LNRSWTREMASPALCRQIEAVALKAHLPPAFLARLLWQESSFRADVVSPAGALGIAQFMPATAQDRGLDDPFDPVRSIETSASLLGDLTRRFGNLGLAAAAYNGGPARVSGWLKGQRSLAAETQAYVQRVTGRPVEDWAAQVGNGGMPGLTAPCRFSAAPAGP
jgi:soluble lytic murein transglycosylase-like protein